MIYSLATFIITLLELVVVLGSYAVASKNIFYTSLVYGSPFYLIMNILNDDSALWDKNWIYIALIAFHIFKYFLFFRAQVVEDRNIWRTMAILFEAAYLCLSGYYLN